MQPVITAAEARALDAATMGEVGLPGVVMMEAAGRGVAAVVADEAARRPGPVAVVCGGGGNGGDGFVVARVLRAAGVDAVAYVVVPRARIGGDAAVHLGAYLGSAGVALDALDGAGLATLTAALARAAIVVDAVFGTGVTRPIEGHLAAVIEAINAAPGRRIAIDVPSGLDADTGHARGVAVQADVTVTMAAPKLGLAIAPGCAAAGRVITVDVGVPPTVLAALAPRAALVEPSDVAGWRRAVDPLAHKNRRGHVLVVAGSPGKRGAGRLTAIAALRAGAGVVTLAGPGDGELAAPDPIMTATPTTAADVAALAAGKQALAIGPGMLDDARGRAWLDAALAAAVPCVIDASGLGHLVGRLEVVAQARGPVVLTPHPGEAARLLGVTPREIEADRPAAVRALAAATRAVVLLKGPRTLVCDGAAGGDTIAINPTGGPALATAGSGDVLTGVIAALLAAGHPPRVAASLGAYVHGAAGDALALRLGLGGVASDLPEAIAAALADPG
ncbi:MAG: NAD(P)H-hydrate dehydratase [Myxococcales bacterium]|nr:NAD(P)H-hydrate dehydratase [Myxococcales bacterium]